MRQCRTLLATATSADSASWSLCQLTFLSFRGTSKHQGLLPKISFNPWYVGAVPNLANMNQKHWWYWIAVHVLHLVNWVMFIATLSAVNSVPLKFCKIVWQKVVGLIASCSAVCYWLQQSTIAVTSLHLLSYCKNRSRTFSGPWSTFGNLSCWQS